MIRFLLLLFLLLPAARADSKCDSANDGDCCTQDQDCTAFLHETLCAVIPLNKTAAEKLTSEKPQPASFCTTEVLSKLREDAANKKPICLEGACEFREDNG